MAVDSPPGITSPSRPASCSGFRISNASAPSARSVAACSRKFPWRARTPMRSCGAIARLYGGLERALERVAVLRRAALEAGAEPLLPLDGRAVRPGLGVHLPLRLLLDAVVADGGGGVERVGDVRLRHVLDQPRLDGVVRPDAGVAVRLE